MLLHRLAAGSLAVLLAASPAAAQQAGTVEVGGFVSYNGFDDAQGLNNKIGFGGRAAVYWWQNWSFEGEFNFSDLNTFNFRGAPGPLEVHYVPLAARANYTIPLGFGSGSGFILGGGVVRADFRNTYNWGPSGLAGIRLGLTPNFALRGDVVANFLPDPQEFIWEVRGGASLLWPPAPALTPEQQASLGGLPQPGTAEVGGFVQYTFFGGDPIDLDNKIGFGARGGVFVTPHVSLEADGSYTEADQASGASPTIRAVPIAFRANYNFPLGFAGARSSALLGAGVVRSHYAPATYNYGFSGLAGLRIGLGTNFAWRTDLVVNYMPEPAAMDIMPRTGLSVFFGGAKPAAPPPVVAIDTTPRQVTPQQPAVDTAGAGARARADSIAAADRARADSAAAAARAREAALAEARRTIEAAIYFDFDKSDIRPDAAATLDAKIPLLQANPNMRIRISGHADERGSDEYNLALGQRRAASARRYLSTRGVAANRIDIISYGEERPVCTESDESCWSRNRRDEFEILVGGDNIMLPNRP